MNKLIVTNILFALVSYKANSLSTMETESSDFSNSSLSRKRRYVAFPEGASISVVGSLHEAFENFKSGHLSLGLAIGCAYDLPNKTWALAHAHGFKNIPNNENAVKSRSRRSLYKKIEIIIDNLGRSGKACMLRALCETSNYFKQEKNNMIVELVKTVFEFPIEWIMGYDELEMFEYEKAYRRGKRKKNCFKFYNECDFSLLHAIFGWYSLEDFQLIKL